MGLMRTGVQQRHTATLPYTSVLHQSIAAETDDGGASSERRGLPYGSEGWGFECSRPRIYEKFADYPLKGSQHGRRALSNRQGPQLCRSAMTDHVVTDVLEAIKILNGDNSCRPNRASSSVDFANAGANNNPGRPWTAVESPRPVTSSEQALMSAVDTCGHQ